MPWFEVVVTASCVVAVEAAGESEATQIAYDEAFDRESYGVKEAGPAKLVRGGEEIDRLLRHADLEFSEPAEGR